MRELHKRATESNTLVLDKHLDSKLQKKGSESSKSQNKDKQMRSQ